MKDSLTNYERIPLTVVSKGVERVPLRSGLNWGQRPGRNQDQAYLPVSSTIQKSNFFPPTGVSFKINCDDGAQFFAVRAQQNGKAIHSIPDNSTLGKYFRERLNITSGSTVLLSHLITYGRTSVDIFKLNESEYYLDFSRLG